MSLSFVGAELLALILESILFGIFIVLAIFSATMLHQRGSDRQPVKWLTLVLVLMTGCSTSYFLVDIVRAFNAFTRDIPAAEYYGNFATQLYTSKIALLVAQFALGEWVNIWRLFLVSNKNPFVVIPPIVCTLSTLGLGTTVIIKLAESVPFPAISHILTPHVILAVCGNIYCSSGIVYIIWRKAARHSVSSRSLFMVMTVVVESSALYTANLIAYLATYLASSNGQWPALDVPIPLVGIIYCLIILQAHYKPRQRIDTGHLASTMHLQSMHVNLPPQRGVGSTNGETVKSSYGMQPLAIEITRQVEHRKDGMRDDLDDQISV